MENVVDKDGKMTGKQGPSPLNGKYRYKGELATPKEIFKLMNEKSKKAHRNSLK